MECTCSAMQCTLQLHHSTCSATAVYLQYRLLIHFWHTAERGVHCTYTVYTLHIHCSALVIREWIHCWYTTDCIVHCTYTAYTLQCIATGIFHHLIQFLASWLVAQNLTWGVLWENQPVHGSKQVCTYPIMVELLSGIWNRGKKVGILVILIPNIWQNFK